jgi:hypothetical protein
VDVDEQRQILTELACDPNVAARERVGALRLLREIELDQPLEDDGEAGEVAEISRFMERRRRRDFETK